MIKPNQLINLPDRHLQRVRSELRFYTYTDKQLREDLDKEENVLEITYRIEDYCLNYEALVRLARVRALRKNPYD